MLILAINTCQAACNGAIIRCGESGQTAILADATEQMRRGQDGRLPGFVSDLCDEANADLAQVDRIAVVTGPGSFTGIRIGIAFARGLALALEKPIVGLTSLEAGTNLHGEQLVALPAQVRPPDRTFWVQSLMDGLGTGQVREIPEAKLKESELILSSPSALIAALKARLIEPSSHPAKPVYARAPDAALPKSSR